MSSPVQVSFLVPSCDEAAILFSAVQSYVRGVEKHLVKTRVVAAKTRRNNDLNYVFKDCQREAPSKVELLVDSRQWEVIDINHEDSAIVVEPELNLLPQIPVCCHGSPLDIIYADTDSVWVPDVTKFQVGDCLRQTRVLSDLPSIFEAFRQEWEPRWKRISQVLPSQWDQIAGFSQRVLPKVSWHFRAWSTDVFLQAIKGKKRRAAVGP